MTSFSLRRGVVLALALSLVLSALWLVAWIQGGRTPGAPQSGLAGRLGAIASDQLFEGEDTRLVVERLSGSVLRGLRLHGVAIEVRDGARWVPWFEAREVRVRYSPLEALGRGHRLRQVEVVGARWQLPRPYDPKPRFKSAQAAPGPVSGQVDWQLDRLRLEGVVGGRDEAPFAAVDVAARLTVGRGFVGADLVSATVEIGDYPPMEATGPVEVRGGSVYLEDVTVRGGSSQMVVRGLLDAESGVNLRLETDPLKLEDLVDATGWQLVGRHGWLVGEVWLRGAWSDLDLAWEFDAKLGRDHLRGMRGRGRLRGATLAIEEAALEVAGVPLAGEGQIALSRGGDSWGRLHFSHARLSSFPVLRAQSWLPPGSLTGSLWVGSSGVGGRPFTLEVTSGDVAGVRIHPGHFAGRLDGVRVHLDKIDVVTDGARAVGQGMIDPERGLTLEHTVSLNDLALFAAMLDLPPLAGQGELRLVLEGPLRAPGFAATGAFRTLGGGPVQLEDVALSLGPGLLGDQRRADFETRAARGVIGGYTVTDVALDGNWRNGRVRFGRVAARSGENTAELRASLTFGAGGYALRLDQVQAMWGGRAWHAASPFSINKSVDHWQLEPFELVSEAARLSASGEMARHDGRLRLAAAVRDVDLRRFAGRWRGSKITGRLRAELTVEGRPGELGAEFDVQGGDLGTSYFAVDSLAVRGSVAGKRLTLDELIVEQNGRIEVNGTVDLPSPLGGDLLHEVRTRAFWELCDMSLTAATPGAAVSAWHGLSDTVDKVDGVVALLARLNGSPLWPSGSASIGSRRIDVAGVRYEEVDTQVALNSGWLSLRAFGARVKGGHVVADGQLPVRFSLMRSTVLDKEAPLGLTFDLAPGDLALSSFVTSKVIDTSGPVRGRVQIGGTLSSPLYLGNVEMDGARLRVTGREEVFEDVTGKVRLAADRIDFREIRARSGEKGRLLGSGVLYLTDGRTDGFDLALRFWEAPFRQTGEYFARASGSLTFSQPRGFPKPLPAVDADLVLHRLDYLREVVGGGGDGGPQTLPSWVGRVHADVPRNAWIRNQDLEVEWKGDLVYERSVSTSTLFGDMDVLRGTYGLFGQTFRIKRGTVSFFDPARIDPYLDIEAETRTPEARIRATITGRASDRQVVLEADGEDIDQAALWKMLVPTETADVSSLVAMTPLIRDIERRISNEIPGVSVSIEMNDPDGGPSGGLGARVGTYVSPEMFVSAYQGLASTADQDVAVEYQLSDLWFLSGEVVRRGVTDGGADDVQEEYNIDLNLRFEF